MLSFKSEGSNSHINDIYKLLDKVVYAPLSEAYKDFLLSMCILDNFTINQAAYIWEGENPASLVDGLVEKNAFIIYDVIEKTYYMHSILPEYKGPNSVLDCKRRF